jgi:DNA relaxase NicK
MKPAIRASSKPRPFITGEAFMLEHQNNLNEQGAPRTAHARSLRGRAQYAAATPSCSNTRETNGDSHSRKAVGKGLEVWTADGTERGLITTNGKHSKLTLTPVPLDSASPDVAHIDWLAFSFMPPDGTSSISELLSQLALLFGLPCIPATSKGRGWNGYATRYDLSDGQDVPLGLIASGGEQQRGTMHVELNAHACALVTDWSAFAVWGESLQAKITRVDLAHDDLDGNTFTMEKMSDWYKQGQFNCGGRQPSHTLAGDWLLDGSPSGRTLYIGKRENGKMLRIYEKGKQLGDSVSPWVRVELQLGGKARIIPWESLTTPGNYLAGSFNCLNFLSDVQEKIRTITKAATISYTRAVAHARLMVGKLVNVMMEVAGGDAFQVISELNRDGHPARLAGYSHLLPQIFAEGAT